MRGLATALCALCLSAGITQAETVLTCSVADFHSFDREDTAFADSNMAKRFTITVRAEEIHVRSTSDDFAPYDLIYPILFRDEWGLHGVTSSPIGLDIVSVATPLVEGVDGREAMVTVQAANIANVWKLICGTDGDAG